MAASFFWYDLETSGTDPRWDRVVQIAGCRTDMELNPVGEELCTYVRLPDDVLPNPDATLVTGITPAMTQDEGIREWQAAGLLHAALAEPGTCALGYNSLRFDDEFVRYLLYRNFRDPYQREWQGGNSRWDLLDLVRATGALRRDGIHWPVDEEGLPVYRLEKLTAANGLEHGQAHDAMSDVRATIAMARLIRQQQPRLFDYHFSIRSKKKVRALLEPIGADIRVHVSGMYPRQRFGCAPILSLAAHPSNNNSIIVFDLLADDAPLHELSAQALCDRLLGDDPTQRPALKEVRLNRCPFIAPLSVLTAENQAHLNIDLNVVRERAGRLRGADLARKIGRVYQLRQEEFNSRQGAVSDPDAALYDGFLRDDDRSRCSAFVEQVNAGNCEALDFDDPRLYTLAERLKARQFPEQLYPEEQQGWRAFVAAKLHSSDVPWLTLPALESRIEALAAAAADDPQRQAALLSALSDHCAQLRQRYPAELAGGVGTSG